MLCTPGGVEGLLHSLTCDLPACHLFHIKVNQTSMLAFQVHLGFHLVFVDLNSATLTAYLPTDPTVTPDQERSPLSTSNYPSCSILRQSPRLLQSLVRFVGMTKSWWYVMGLCCGVMCGNLAWDNTCTRCGIPWVTRAYLLPICLPNTIQRTHQNVVQIACFVRYTHL